MGGERSSYGERARRLPPFSEKAAMEAAERLRARYGDLWTALRSMIQEVAVRRDGRLQRALAAE